MKATTTLLLVIALLVSTQGAVTQDAAHSFPFPFAEATIGELQAKMTGGELTARALAEAYLKRIDEIDRHGPKLNAVIELNPEALAIADQLDRERATGKFRGPLHGIPVLIKDNIATADRMETTAGSLALVGSRPPRDAYIVTRLREAGAVVLGKTNLSEWANFRGDHSISGWSARGGQTLNPYALDRNPSGSSSGSAVAVAANLCVVAVGTETDGSILSPASNGGLVGIKPTVGVVSRTGIIPISASQDTAGPMARTVTDAAILLSILSHADPADGATQARPPGFVVDFAAAVKIGALRGARIGVIRELATVRTEVASMWSGIIDALRAAGAEVVDSVETPAKSHALGEAEMIVLSYEFKHGINAWFTGLGPNAKIKSLKELIAFNESHRAEELRLFGQEALIESQARGPLTDADYLRARDTSRQLSREEGIDAVMTRYRLDAIVALSGGAAWLIDPVNGDAFTGGSSRLAAVAGYPSITVPAGNYFGLPIGVSFIGHAWDDAKLLGFAADFEAQTHARREPRFRPSVELPSAK